MPSIFQSLRLFHSSVALTIPDNRSYLRPRALTAVPVPARRAFLPS